MARNTYVLSEEQFKGFYKKIEEIYCNINLLKLFCKEYSDTEDIYKIIPLVNYTYKISDILYAEIINLENE